ncbi:uncharacterized protein LOC115876587 [Sitophilus oryzae]|uniref:Uncharacterized protein LOC115876587 n=1 Tax=Sitophilus oryzae TaxID=7048 RepID=A0A6J2XAT6_SITOR|nr:uncharacterized protein LOC115876587 [Sitophilus oryzae]
MSFQVGIYSCDYIKSGNYLQCSSPTSDLFFLLEFLLAYNLEVLNIGNTPTYVKDWRVSTEPSLSDHRIIEFKLRGIILQTEIRRNPRKTDWELYHTNLVDNLDQIDAGRARNHLYLEWYAKEVNSAILDAYESSCPTSKGIQKSSNKPWWNKKLANQAGQSEVRRLFNRAKPSGEWQLYAEKFSEYNKEIRRAKRSDFRYFCENITSITYAARLHKAMAKSSISIETQVAPTEPHNPRREDWETAKLVLTEQKLKWAIDTFQPYKTAGIDGIFPALLKKAEDLS